MRYAPEMAKPWMWTNGTPLPPLLRRYVDGPALDLQVLRHPPVVVAMMCHRRVIAVPRTPP